MSCVRSTASVFLLSFLFLSAGYSAAQPLKVDVDHAVFASSPGESVLAVYVMLSGDEIGTTTQKRLGARFSPAGGRPAREASTVAARHPLGYLTASIETILPAGDYEVEIFDAAAGSDHLVLARKQISVEATSTGRQAMISGIVLGTGANDDLVAQSSADRSALAIEPKPDLVFGRSHSRLYYYFETYNADLAVSNQDRYTLAVYIADANRERPIARWSRELERTAVPHDRIAGAFSIDELPSGSYQLTVQIRRNDGQTLAERSKRFFSFNPGVPPLETDDSISAVFEHPDALSAGDLDRMLSQMRVIANPSEADRLRRLSSREEKLAFVDQFWTSRESQEAHRGDQTMMGFMRRIEMVNARFGTQRREGWQTDQGATVLKYGEPIAIHVEDFRTGTNFPYEIWQYRVARGAEDAIFVFVDRTGFGEFELIHSTMPGERRNPNWRREVMRAR